ncbi:MAG: aldo/keto reductase [Geminicoccaceae bacterium]
MKIETKRPIGRTDLMVSQMGFGGAPLGNMYEGFTDEVARAAVLASFDAGMSLFDTAPLYGHGLSEHRVGEALRGKDRDAWVLSTKIGRLLKPAAPAEIDSGIFQGVLPFKGVFDYSYDAVMRSVEDSFQRIGTHRIDILLAHDLDVWTHRSEEARQTYVAQFMAGGYRAMVELREQGAIKAIGAGVNEVSACQDLLDKGDFDTFLLAGRYTLLEQGALDGFLPRCAERGVTLMIGGPYNTGILATGAVEGAYYNYQPAPSDIMERVAKIEAVTKNHGVPLATAALHFPLHHPQVASIIPGVRHPDEVARNKTIFESQVPDALWHELKAEGLVREDAPTP